MQPEGAAWLMLDEPVASLDIGHQLMVMRLVAGYAARGGGVVAVMHDLNLTAMFAHRVLLLDEGRVVATGAPAEVLTDALLTQDLPHAAARQPDAAQRRRLPAAAGRLRVTESGS